MRSLEELYEAWVNGNCREVADELVANNKLSDAIAFALKVERRQPDSDLRRLLTLLQNRNS